MAKEVKFIPSVCKVTTDDDTHEVIQPTFKGHIILRKLTLDEKFAFMENSGVEIGEEDGKNVVNVPKGSKAFASTRALVSGSKKHYVEVDLTRLADGEHFASVEDLEVEHDCHPIMVEVANRLVSGFTIGSEPKEQ